MVFKFATFDPAQDPDNFNPAFPPTPSSSPSTTLCQTCEYTYTFTKTMVGRLVAAGYSLILKAPAFEFDGHETGDQSTEMPRHSLNFDVGPEFHKRELKEFTLAELYEATQHFSHENILGRGGFGVVYKGQLADGSLVAIKRARPGSQSQSALLQFKTEVLIGGIIPLRYNLLPMLGYCSAAGHLLVYPLMINISLASWLRERNNNQPPLDWPTRRKIAVGAARGLSHLHDRNIVHRDIKAANIMLDGEFEPHIGDFGLAKLIDRSQGEDSVDSIHKGPVLARIEYNQRSAIEFCEVRTELRGTIGHIAPEYNCTGKCSVKTDVFAFGIMLLEVVTGKKPYDSGFSSTLLNWVKRRLKERRWDIIVDPDLQGADDGEDMEKVIQLALLCTQLVPRKRPSMAQVVQILKGHSIKERWEEYQTREPFWLLEQPWIIYSSNSHLIAEELSGPR